MNKYVIRYVEHFKEAFPFYLVPRMTDDELNKFIMKCLEEDKPAVEYYPIEKNKIY